MSKKFMLFLSMLIIASLFISGCVFEDTSKANQTIGPDFIPRTNLPTGFTFMGIHETPINIDNSTVTGFEGVYRYGGNDIYIMAIKNDNPETLLSKYKADIIRKFRPDYNPFEDISINGHAATKLTDTIILDGKQELRYSIIWASNGYMIQVGSFADIKTVISLATATGY